MEKERRKVGKKKRREEGKEATKEDTGGEVTKRSYRIGLATNKVRD